MPMERGGGGSPAASRRAKVVTVEVGVRTTPRSGGRARPTPRELAEMLLVGVAYYAAARLSLRFALIGRNITPLWPPTGIALVAFLRLGKRTWPGIALAAYLVNLPISANVLAAASTAAGNTAAPIVGAWLLELAGFHAAIDRIRDVVALVVAALLGMLISATVGAGTLVASG